MNVIAWIIYFLVAPIFAFTTLFFKLYFTLIFLVLKLTIKVCLLIWNYLKLYGQLIVKKVKEYRK